MDSDNEREEESTCLEDRMEARLEGMKEFLVESLEKVLTAVSGFDRRMKEMEDRFEIAEKGLEVLSKTCTDKMQMDTIIEAPCTSTPKGTEAQPLETPPPPPKKLKTAKGVKIPVSLSDLTPELADRIRRANIKLNRDAKSKLTYAQNAYIALWFQEKTETGVVVTGKYKLCYIMK
ncbi:hypothetical protein SNE40_005918 [Patella caerulea]|uniref:Uncharacterized protein n=1 Tax=Patella caerulea TaxID=87958 RepID=A0AAN8PZA3_PATCE